MSEFDRRRLLAAAAAGFVSSATPVLAQSNKDGFALVLGGGGARGLSHIPILEVLDELGVRPSAIVGTSIGAILGACYASGMTGRDIREYAADLFGNRLTTIRRLFPGDPADWGSFFSLTNTAVLEAEILMESALPQQVPQELADLPIPLSVIASDFDRQSEVVISQGNLRRAVGASAALPVFLAPVDWDGRILIDGGFVNPTPFDVAAPMARRVIAVDLTGNGSPAADGGRPGALETWIGASQIALHSLVAERLKISAPDVLIRPDIRRFSTLEFHRIDEILEATIPARDEARKQIGALLERDG